MHENWKKYKEHHIDYKLINIEQQKNIINSAEISNLLSPTQFIGPTRTSRLFILTNVI
jgi:hypothetical protein